MSDLINRKDTNRLAAHRPTFEAYTLVLKHSIWDGRKEYELEEPIAVRCMVETKFGAPTYMVNEMMDKMKHELLLRCGEVKDKE